VYEAAKRDGITNRPSPKKNQHSRGTGTRSAIPAMLMRSCLASLCDMSLTCASLRVLQE